MSESMKVAISERRSTQHIPEQWRIKTQLQCTEGIPTSTLRHDTSEADLNVQHWNDMFGLNSGKTLLVLTFRLICLSPLLFTDRDPSFSVFRSLDYLWE